MPNTNFVPNWTFERTLPSPFDIYSGKSAVMKDIASKYCNQPKKRATLHSATLQAVFSYMDLENPPAGKAEEELGAIGSQANNFTIAEYPSRTGLLHVPGSRVTAPNRFLWKKHQRSPDSPAAIFPSCSAHTPASPSRISSPGNGSISPKTC